MKSVCNFVEYIYASKFNKISHTKACIGAPISSACTIASSCALNPVLTTLNKVWCSIVQVMVLMLK